MGRALESAVLAEIVKPRVRMAHLVSLAFDGGVQYYTTHSSDIEWGGHTWQSSPNLLRVSDIREDSEVRIQTATVTLSSVNQANLSVALTEDYTDREMNVYVAFITNAPDKRWGFDEGLEGWGTNELTGRGIVTWQENGTVLWESNAEQTNPFFYIPLSTTIPPDEMQGHEVFDGSDLWIVRAMVRRVSGSGTWEGRCMYLTSGHGAGEQDYSKSISEPANPDEWNILEWDMSDLTAGGGDWVSNIIGGIRIDLVSAGTVAYEFDWIEITRSSSAKPDPANIFSGRIDSFKVSENPRSGTSTLEWKASSHFADFDRVNGRFTNNESQQIHFPGDRFFEFAYRDPTQITWGRRPLNRPPALQPIGADRPVIRTTVDIANTVAPIPVIYGQEQTEGIRTFIGKQSAPAGPGQSETLYIIHTLCEGEISGVPQILLDDVPHTDSRWNHPETGSSLVSCTVYTGTDTQTAHAPMVSAINEWTADHRGLGVAYVVTALTYHEDVFDGMPTFRFVVNGKNNNAARAIEDYLTNSRYGKGLDPSALDGFDAAATICDQDIDAQVGTFKQFRADGIIDTSRTMLDNLKDLLRTCRGYLPYTGGKYVLRIERNESPVFEFTPDNITGGWTFETTGIRSRYNRVEAKFTNPLRNYQQDIAAVDSDTFRSQDNGRLLKTDYSLPLCNNVYRAMDDAEIVLRKSRQQLKTSFSGMLPSMVVSPGDIIEVTHPTPDWIEKQFRVDSITIKANGDFTFSLSEHEPNVYNRGDRLAPDSIADTNLPNPYTVAEPTGLILESGEEHLVMTSDGSIVSRIYIQWTPATDIFVTGYQVQYRRSDGGEWVDASQVTGGQSGEAYAIGVRDLVAYDVRVRSVNVLGRHSAWLTEEGHTVEGKSAPPPDVTDFRVTRLPDGTREFSWQHQTPIDHAGYSIRYRSGTGHTWEDMEGFELNTHGYIEHAPFESIYPLVSGMFTFAIKAYDRSGNESVNAAFIIADLGLPRIAGSLFFIDAGDEGWPGTITDGYRDTGWVVANNQDEWQTLPNQWQNWNQWNSDPVSSFIYEHPEIDLGGVVAITPLATVVTDSDSLVEMAIWNGSSYEDWEPLGPTVTDKIKLRVTVTQSSTELPILRQFVINITAGVIEEDIEDIDTSALAGAYRIGTGDIRIPITKNFTVIRLANIILQNVGAGWSWEIVDKDTTVGPRVRIYNSSNTLADAIIDAYVRGL